MKKVTGIVLAMALMLSLAACQNSASVSSTQSSAPAISASTPVIVPNTDSVSDTANDEQNNASANNGILIAYFSLFGSVNYPEGVDATASASIVMDNDNRVGTTEYVARIIQQSAGGDLHLIQTVETYSTNFDEVIEQNHEEMNADILPVLTESDLDATLYDTIFIGYPVWAANAPQAIFSFLSQYDLSGKTIIPFCTHDGYGAGSSYGDIAQAIPGAAPVLDGLAIEASDVPSSAATVTQWLNEIGVNGEAEGAEPASETAITITVGDTVLEGVLYDTALAKEIQAYFPLTLSMVGFGGREFYGGVDFYPENLEGGQRTFENGDITYCEAHHNMAVFYAQTDNPTLSVDVIPIGRVTSDLRVFDALSGRIEITFALAD